jgi:hypothetical protein
MQPTPLQELYENSKGMAKRCAVAQAVESQRQQECTFTPNLSKPGLVQASPPEAKLSLSASVSWAGVAVVVHGYDSYHLNLCCVPHGGRYLLRWVTVSCFGTRRYARHHWISAQCLAIGGVLHCILSLNTC